MEPRKIAAVYCVVVFLLLKDHAAQSRSIPLNKNYATEVRPIFRNQSSPFDLSPDLYTYHSVYQSNVIKQDTYYGVKASIDIYGHEDLVKDQITSGMIWVVNTNEQGENLEAIEVGWHVHPGIYGDTKTHFFVLWTADGYKSWCYNRNCSGFNFSPGAGNSTLEPGSVLPTSTDQVKHTLTIRIVKEKEAWSLFAAVDGPNTYIGNFPGSLFKNLKDKATDINFGGFAQSPKKIISPPMGSGYLNNSVAAATIKDVQYLDSNGNAYGIDWELWSYDDGLKCYSLGNFENNQFSYGGPGGCTGHS